MFRQSTGTRYATTKSRRRGFARGRTRLWLQGLEDRTSPAVLTVMSAADDGGATTLRGVMATADTNGQDDTIQFGAGISTINLASGELLLSNEAFNLTINGTGVTINGAPTASANNRIFNFNVAGGDPTITINGLTLVGGNVSTGSGGAILVNNDPLVLDGITLSGNRITGTGAAIGITAPGSNISFINSKAINNRATSTGGVIVAPAGTSSTITLTNSLFDTNAATTGSVVQSSGTVALNVSGSKLVGNYSSGTGGAINLAVAGSTLTVNQSTFSDNLSTGGSAIAISASTMLLIENSTFDGNKTQLGNAGGAIRYTVAFPVGGYVVRQCTFTGNLGGFNGSALGFSTLTGTATIQNCTFADNVAMSTGNGAIGVNSVGTGTIALESCLFSGNRAAGNTTVVSPDIFHPTGTVTANNCLISSSAGILTFLPSGTTAALMGQAAKLGPLANHGGPTNTMTLLAGSPAINQGSNPAGLTTDQRGGTFARETLPADPADIGATEGVFVNPFAKSVTLPNVAPINAKYVATVVYSDNNGIDTGSINVGDVRLTGKGYATPKAPNSATIVAGSMGSLSVTVQYEFDPPGAGWTAADNDVYSLQLQSGQVLDIDGKAAFAAEIGRFHVQIGQTFLVNQSGDIDDMDPNNGMMTLREAVRLANTNNNTAAVDAITFDSALNGVPIVVNGGELSVSEPISLNGNGAANTIISGGGVNRMFNLAHSGLTSLISNMTLTNGSTTAAGGAVVMNASMLTVFNSKFTGNSGGTIANVINLGLAILRVFDSDFSGNTGSSTVGGGAIGTGTGIIEITRTTFDSNTTTGSGSAIFVNGAGILSIVDSTLSNNTSSGTTGGAIATTAGLITITNSTVSSNINSSGSAVGGGLRLTTGAIVTVNNSTITKNSAGGGGGGIGMTFTAKPVPQITLNSTIVAQNVHATHPDLLSTATTIPMTVTLNQSLLGAKTDADITITNNGSMVGPDLTNDIDAKLSSLGNFGGAQKTHGLLLGSPAIDMGSNSLGLEFDQRGPGFPRELGAPDIGAFEGVISVPSATATLPNVPPINAKYIATVVYADADGINTTQIDTGDVRLTGKGYAVPQIPNKATITMGMNGDKSVTVEYEFDPPGAGWTAAHNGFYTLSLQANEIFDTMNNAAIAGPIGMFSVGIAQSLIVNQIGDVDDLDPNNGMTTLREAINLANASPNSLDTITFDASINGMIITLNAQLPINDKVSIQGNGPLTMTINGAGGASATNRIFNTDGAPSGADISISGLTLNGGNITGNGGAIFVGDESLTLTNVVVSNNVSSAIGGGIVLTSAAASITVHDSTFSGNSSTAGGAITVLTTSSVFVDGSTFVGNITTVGNSGGAIRYVGAPGVGNYTIRNSTFTGNQAGFNGGALGFSSLTGTVVIQNSTFAGNTAATAGTGSGGAIGVNAGTGTVMIESSIVFGNLAGATPSDFLVGGTVIANTSMIGTNAGITTFTPDATTTNLLGQDPLLDLLADNGGPTQTMKLMTGSPAFNKGSNPANLMFDQRGPGFPRVLNGISDIGAVENMTVIPTAKATAPDVPPSLGTVTVTVEYADETAINTGGIDVNDVTLSGPGYPTPVSPTTAMFSGSGKMVTATYVFPTPIGGWDWPYNGKYVITMQANEVFDTDGPNAVFPGPIGSFITNIPLPALVVDNIDDLDDGKFGPGQLTLREAINLTNNSPNSTDSISFAPALNGMTIILGSNLPITDGLIITGPGANNLTISGGGIARHFDIVGSGATSVSISGLTLSGGNTTTTGGSIQLSNASLALSRMVLTSNSATSFAGAIAVLGSANLSITESSLVANSSSSGGGAIYVQGGTAANNVDIVRSLIANNTSTNSGAGILLGVTTTTTVSVVNSTISGNVSSLQAGGIRGYTTFTGVVNIRNSTIVGNSATTAAGGLGAGAGTWNVTSSIVAQNVGPTGDLGGAFNIDFSLIGAADGGTITGGNNIKGTIAVPVDPMLDVLADNGGPTQTMKLLPGSLAINKGSNPAALAFDQRGSLYARNSGGGVDIGAFEIQAPPQVTNVLVNNGAMQRSLVTSITVQFDNSFVLTPGAFVLSRIANGMAGTIGLVATPVGNDVVLTFNNTGSIMLDPGASLPDGTYQLTIVANNVTGTAGTLDGNKNGISEGSTTDDVTSKLHRLFGDGNGDGTVTAADFNAFRLVYGSVGPSIYDYDNSGDVTAADFNAFRLRYGLSGYAP